jgi:hypothetical protein
MPKLYPAGDAEDHRAIRMMLGRRVVVTHPDHGVFFAWIEAFDGTTLTTRLEDPAVPEHFSEPHSYDMELAD